MTPRDNAFLKYDFVAVNYDFSGYHRLTQFEETSAMYLLRKLLKQFFEIF